MSKGVFIEGITVEMLRNASLEAVETLLNEGYIEDVEIPRWIPVKWHYITDEEREREGYPKDWVYHIDCEMPEDEQEILVTTNHGCVEKDVCYLDDGFSLDSGWEWVDDIVAWMPMPEQWKENHDGKVSKD